MTRRPPALHLAALVIAALVVAGCTSDDPGGDASPPTSDATATSTAASATTVVGTTVAGTQLDGPAAFLGPVRTIEHRGLTISYRQFGEGPVLLLIQGQASPMSLWPLSWLEDVSASHRVTMYDLRGIGLSEDDAAEPLRLGQLADDAAALAGAVASTPIDVFGLSTGGEIGLLLAATHPETVDDLVVSGASLGGPGTVEGDPEAIAALEDPTPSPTAQLAAIFPAGDEAVHRFVADLGDVPQTVVSPDVIERYADAEDAYIDDPALPALWAQIEAPVLVHNGADDVLIPAVNATQLAEAIPNATSEVTPGAKHYAYYQEAATVLPLFESFWSA